jgi:hypothetical protein
VKWKKVKFCVWVEIDFPTEGYVEGPQGAQEDCGPEPAYETEVFDVIRFSSEFELNGIPSA